MTKMFDNRVALVTGGSRGIGRATCLALAREGARVAINYVSDEKAAQSILQDVQAVGGDGGIYQADVANPSVKTYQAKAPNETIRAYRDQILSELRAGIISLVDVRAPAEYSGELLAPENLPQEGSQRGGHIPTAVNVPWGQAVADDGTFKSIEDLRSIYGSKGINGGNETISYCRIGERSSHTWFVLTQLLGHNNVRNYDGSWTEWGSIVGAPIER